MCYVEILGPVSLPPEGLAGGPQVHVSPSPPFDMVVEEQLVAALGHDSVQMRRLMVDRRSADDVGIIVTRSIEFVPAARERSIRYHLG